MREPVEQQLSEQLRARLVRALGEQPAVAEPQRAATAAPPRRHDLDESMIRTVLRDPHVDQSESLGAGGAEEEASGQGSIVRPTSAVVGRVGERLPFTRRHLVIVVVIATLAIALAGWFLLQARAVPLEGSGEPEVVVSQPPSASPTAPSASVSSVGESSPMMIKVHVTGGVRHPKVVSVPEGARVEEVIGAAGGVTKGAVLGQLNLAQPVRDGQQVYVSTSKKQPSEIREPGAASGGSSSQPSGAASPGAGAQVDLNAATAADLEALPGVGPVTAQGIVAWREQHGRFSRIEELQEVDGIGTKTFSRLAPHVRV